MCDLNSIGEAQTREVASHAGLGEEYFQNNSICKVFGSEGKKWNWLEEKQCQCCQKQCTSVENTSVVENGREEVVRHHITGTFLVGNK